eukprot:2761932-Pyramimonas_sp.AAC.1
MGLDYADQQRVVVINVAPLKIRGEAPPKYQQEGMPTFTSYSKSYDKKDALIYTPGDPKAEPQGA